MVATHVSPPTALPRVELFRLLADEGRLRLLALAAEEEITVGELSDLLDESQPQVSRKAAPLRQAGLLAARKDGTRTLLKVSLAGPFAADPVVKDALDEGRRLCARDGSLARVHDVIAAREERSQRFFDEDGAGAGEPAASTPPPGDALSAPHLFALAPLLPERRLALDVGAGEGQLLDVLAPLYERVIAVDKSRARLARCARRVAQRGHANVRLFEGSFDDTGLLAEVDRAGGADLVFAGRILHHMSRPSRALETFARLLKRGGHLVVLDYLPHDDESMREAQADVWLGFDPDELSQKLEAAGLVVTASRRVPDALHPEGPDAHLAWQALVAVKR